MSVSTADHKLHWSRSAHYDDEEWPDVPAFAKCRCGRLFVGGDIKEAHERFIDHADHAMAAALSSTLSSTSPPDEFSRKRS